MRRLWITLLTGLLAITAQAAEPRTLQITFLHVNDVHGRLESHTHQGKFVGGYARLASAVEAARREPETARVFLIHAGDEFSRGDGLTTATLGAANVAIMNHIGFDCWTPGNGEFYIGVPALMKRVGEAQFHVLAANVFMSHSDQPLLSAYQITDIHGCRVALFGLCYVRQEHPSAWVLDVKDPVEIARELVPQLRRQADLVVAITHLGVDMDKKLAGEVPGIDLIIGGHSHIALREGARVNRPGGSHVLIVQAGEHLRQMGRVDVQMSGTDHGWTVNSAVARLVSLDASVPQDPAVKALIARLAASTQPASVPAGNRELDR